MARENVSVKLETHGILLMIVGTLFIIAGIMLVVMCDKAPVC